MVTKRYIKKGEKNFGPYYYESYRDKNGRVRKRYLKNYNPEKKPFALNFLPRIIGAILIIIAILVLSQQITDRLTGSTIVMGNQETYELGEKIKGTIELNVLPGELIPKDSLVSVKLGDFEDEFVLSDFVDYQPTEGNFYAHGTSLSGSGEGFGLPGEKKIYPTVSFELRVYQETDESDSEDETSSEEEQVIEAVPEENTETTQTEDFEAASEENTETTQTEVIETISNEETSTETASDSESEQSAEESSETTSEESSESESAVTGGAISESEHMVSGQASHDEEFIYSLDSDETAEIVSGSVTVDGEQIPDDSVSLEIKDGKVEVSTDYYISEEGFGEEYLGEGETLTFRIDLEDFDLSAVPGELNVMMSHDGQEISSFEQTINVIQPEIQNATNQTIFDENATVSNLTLLQEIPTIRIAADESAVLELSDYFSGAESYEFIASDISASFSGSSVELTPDSGFKGARKAKFIAHAGQSSLESNDFLILVSTGAVQITTSKQKIVVGETVKWKKEISIENPETISVEIPKDATNLNIKKITADGEEEVPLTETGNSFVTGNVVIDVKLEREKKPLIFQFTGWLKKQLKLGKTITGNVVEEQVQDSSTEVVLDELDAEGYVLEYETEAPIAVEEITSEGKLIIVSGPDEITYENVIASANLNNEVSADSPEKIEIYWRNYESVSLEAVEEITTITPSEVPETEVVELVTTGNETNSTSQVTEETNNTNQTVEETKVSLITGSVVLENNLSGNETNSSAGVYAKEKIAFDSYDLDGDGKIDYVEWVVPHLSNQTYELIIVNANGTTNITEEATFSHLAISATAPYDSLVAYWNFDGDAENTQSTTAFDFTLNNIDGTYTGNAVANNLLCVYADCLQLDGNNDYVSLGSISAFKIPTKTISFWANPANAVTDWQIPFGGTSGNYYIAFRFSTNRSTISWANSSNVQTSTSTSNNYVLPGTWAHYAIVFSVSESTVNVTAYRNGAVQHSFQNTQGYSSTYGTNFYIGILDGVNFDFNGSLDEVMFFNTTLTGTQISAIYNNQSARFKSAGEVLFTNFADLSNRTEMDISLTDCETFLSSSIKAKVNDGGYQVLTSCAYENYNLTGLTGLNNSNLTIQLTSDSNNFYTPLAIQNTTLVATGDSIYPQINFTSPTETSGTTINRNNILINVTATDATLTNITVYLFNSTQGLVNSTNSTVSPFFVNFTGLADGLYYFNATATDDENNRNSTETRSVTIQTDAVAPNITLIAPPNNSNFNVSSITFNVSTNENASWCGLSINGNANVTMTLNSSLTGANYTNTSIADGSHSFVVSCNDTANNFGATPVSYFLVDTIIPQVNFTGQTPSSGSSQSATAIAVNVSSSDSNDHYTFVDFDRSNVLWIRGDDSNSTAVFDLSGYGNNGTYDSTDGPSITDGGYFGRGIYFDRVGAKDGAVSVPYTDSLNLTTVLTVSAWIKPAASVNSNPGIVVKGSVSANWRLYLDYTNSRTVFDSAGGTHTIVSPTNSLSYGQWRHVAIVANSTSMYLYENGSLVNSTSGTFAYCDVLSGCGTEGITIGHLNGAAAFGSPSGFNGTIDDVLIFNRTLSASEISSLYNASANKYYNNFTGLAGGAHTFTGFTVDKGGNRNQTEQRSVTIVTDTTAPNITLIAPPNNSNFNISSVTFNVSTNENATWCGLSINGNANVTMTLNSSLTGANYTNTSIADGSHSFVVSCNDTVNNFGASSIHYFLVDTIIPQVNFTGQTPSNGSSQSATSIAVNVSSSDLNDHYTFVDFDRSNVLWMRMDDVDGSGNPLDLSSHGNNGSKQGSAAQATPGYFGKGFSFDGSGGSSVEITGTANSLDFKAGGLYSWSFWIKAPNSSTQRAIFSKGTVTTGYEIFHKNQEIIFGDEIGSDAASCTNCLADNIWTHVVMLVNFNDCEITYYINGLLNWTSAGPPAGCYANTDPSLVIGSGSSSSNFNGTIDEFLMFNRTLSAQEIKALYNASVNKYYNNFTSLVVGNHTFTGYAADKGGNRNQTERRSVTIDTTAPTISYALPTPNNGEISDSNSLFVNVTTSNDADMDTITFKLYDSTPLLVNSSNFRDSTRSINFTGLSAGTYSYLVTINDTSGNSASTDSRTYTIISSCFNQTTCVENLSCQITSPCVLHSGLCTGSQCDFTNMTLNTTIYTLYNGANGRNLTINITSNSTRSGLTFLSGAKIIFSGKNGTDIGSGSSGGNGGILNITVPDLFNTTNANFTGTGGYTTQTSALGGNGGNVYLNYHGLIRKFTLGTTVPNLAAGSSASIVFGTTGAVTYNKDLTKCPRDADVNGDGVIDIFDRNAIRTGYNRVFGESLFNQTEDINCDNKTNVIELAKTGLEWDTR